MFFLFNVTTKNCLVALKSQVQSSFGSHDVFDDEFRGGVSSWKVVYRLDHLAIGDVFVL